MPLAAGLKEAGGKICKLNVSNPNIEMPEARYVRYGFYLQ
jgi:hypothetical protein